VDPTFCTLASVLTPFFNNYLEKESLQPEPFPFPNLSRPFPCFLPPSFNFPFCILAALHVPFASIFFRFFAFFFHFHRIFLWRLPRCVFSFLKDVLVRNLISSTVLEPLFLPVPYFLFFPPPPTHGSQPACGAYFGVNGLPPPAVRSVDRLSCHPQSICSILFFILQLHEKVLLFLPFFPG